VNDVYEGYKLVSARCGRIDMGFGDTPPVAMLNYGYGLAETLDAKYNQTKKVLMGVLLNKLENAENSADMLARQILVKKLKGDLIELEGLTEHELAHAVQFLVLSRGSIDQTIGDVGGAKASNKPTAGYTTSQVEFDPLIKSLVKGFVKWNNKITRAEGKPIDWKVFVKYFVGAISDDDFHEKTKIRPTTEYPEQAKFFQDLKQILKNMGRDNYEQIIDSEMKSYFTPDFGIKVENVEKVTGKVTIADAEIVVSAGRGMKGPENWGMIEELASVLGAATACSKPVSDIGWRPHSEHVGQTGKPVASNLYIAVGISGAIQHIAGINSSKVKVVINTDPEAPFFKVADYGVVGDAFTVVPQLIEKLKAFKASNS
jgi:hypothetical protein